MSIDKQRIAAVATLEALGFKYTSDRGWLPPINRGREAIGGTLPDFTAEAGALHAVLARRCFESFIPPCTPSRRSKPTTSPS